MKKFLAILMSVALLGGVLAVGAAAADDEDEAEAVLQTILELDIEGLTPNQTMDAKIQRLPLRVCERHKCLWLGLPGWMDWLLLKSGKSRADFNGGLETAQLAFFSENGFSGEESIAELYLAGKLAEYANGMSDLYFAAVKDNFAFPARWALAVRFWFYVKFLLGGSGARLAQYF